MLNHPARDHIAAVRARVGELDEDARAAADEHAQGVVERAGSVLDYVDGLLATADPALASAAALAGIETAFAQASDLAGRLPSEPVLATSLDEQLEAALTAAAPLAAASPVSLARLTEAGKKFSTALTGAVRDAREELSRLHSELDVLEQRRQEAADTVTAADAERQTTLKQAMEQLESRINTEQQRLDQLVPQFEKQFADDQETRRTEFTNLRDTLQAASEQTAKKLNESAEQTRAELEQKAKETFEAVDSRREDVERLYGVITDTATAGAFNKEAAAQKTFADAWRKVAIWFGLAAALLAVGFIVWSGLDKGAGESVGAIVAKLTATLAAAGIAAYAGRQSGRHREREEEAKRLELDLVALGPFLEGLSPSEREAVRKAYAERAFTGRGGQADVSGRRTLFGRKDDTFGLTPEVIAAIAAAARGGVQQ